MNGGPPQQQRPAQPRPAQQPMQFPSTTTLSDLTQAPALTEAYCHRQLSHCEVYTLQKAEPLESSDPRDPRIVQELKRNGKSSRNSTRSKSSRQGDSTQSKSTRHGDSVKPKSSWLTVTMNREVFDQDVIWQKIQELDSTGDCIADKKNKLRPHMNSQVNKLLDEKNNLEFDKAFCWTPRQLERIPWYNKESGKWETETLVLYLKRAPQEGINVMQLYRAIEMAKARQNQPPPQQLPQQPPQQHQQHPQQQQQQQQQRQQQQQQQQRPGGPPLAKPPPGGQEQGPPKGRMGPQPVNGPKNMGPKNNSKAGGRDIDEIITIDAGGERRKEKPKLNNKARKTHGKPGTAYDKTRQAGKRRSSSKSSRSSDSGGSSDRSSFSGSGSESGSDSEAGSVYSTDPSSMSSNTGHSPKYARRDGGYNRIHLKQHYLSGDEPRERPFPRAPEPPLRPIPSWERLSSDPHGVGQRAINDAYTGTLAALAEAGIINQRSNPLQKTVHNADGPSPLPLVNSLDGNYPNFDGMSANLKNENRRLRDELQHTAEQLTNLKLEEELLRKDNHLRSTLMLQDELQQKDAQLRRALKLKNELQQREEQIRTALRFTDRVRPREEIQLQRETRRAEDSFRRDSLPSPRIIKSGYLRERSWSPSSPRSQRSEPLSESREYERIFDSRMYEPQINSRPSERLYDPQASGRSLDSQRYGPSVDSRPSERLYDPEAPRRPLVPQTYGTPVDSRPSERLYDPEAPRRPLVPQTYGPSVDSRPSERPYDPQAPGRPLHSRTYGSPIDSRPSEQLYNRRASERPLNSRKYELPIDSQRFEEQYIPRTSARAFDLPVSDQRFNPQFSDHPFDSLPSEREFDRSPSPRTKGFERPRRMSSPPPSRSDQDMQYRRASNLERNLEPHPFAPRRPVRPASLYKDYEVEFI